MCFRFVYLRRFGWAHLEQVLDYIITNMFIVDNIVVLFCKIRCGFVLLRFLIAITGSLQRHFIRRRYRELNQKFLLHWTFCWCRAVLISTRLDCSTAICCALIIFWALTDAARYVLAIRGDKNMLLLLLIFIMLFHCGSSELGSLIILLRSLVWLDLSSFIYSTLLWHMK